MAERSEARPPLPEDPPKAHSLENSYTNKDADIRKDTHTYTYIDTNEQTSAYTEDARQN